MIVWGIDVGATTGYGVLDDGQLKYNGEWNLGDSPERRTWTLWSCLALLAESGRPGAIAYERGGWTNMNVAVAHGGYYGVIEMFAANIGASVMWFAPATIKRRFGDHGGADKDTMMDAFERRFGHWPRGDNAADAAAIAVVYHEELTAT